MYSASISVSEVLCECKSHYLRLIAFFKYCQCSKNMICADNDVRATKMSGCTGSSSLSVTANVIIV